MMFILKSEVQNVDRTLQYLFSIALTYSRLKCMYNVLNNNALHYHKYSITLSGSKTPKTCVLVIVKRTVTTVDSKIIRALEII